MSLQGYGISVSHSSRGCKLGLNKPRYDGRKNAAGSNVLPLSSRWGTIDQWWNAESIFTEVHLLLGCCVRVRSFKYIHLHTLFVCVSGSGPTCSIRTHSPCPCFEPFWQFFCTVGSFTFRYEYRFTVLILLPTFADQPNSLYYGVNQPFKIPWMHIWVTAQTGHNGKQHYHQLLIACSTNCRDSRRRLQSLKPKRKLTPKSSHVWQLGMPYLDEAFWVKGWNSQQTLIQCPHPRSQALQRMCANA